MKVWRIALKELMMIRDIKMVIFLIASPVLLTLILGTMLSSAFNANVAVREVRVLYTIDGADSSLTMLWNRFAERAEDAGVHFVPAGGETDARLEVEHNRYAGYVEVTEDGLSYIGNGKSGAESDMAKGMLAAFADRYKLASAMAQENPGQETALAAASGIADRVSETTFQANRQPRALDYYAIAMITMIILFGAMTAADLIDGERKRNTAARLLVSPVTKAEIFAGKAAGNFLLNAVSVVIVVLATKYMLQVYWGDRLDLVLLVLFAEIVFALSLGLGFSYLFKGSLAGALIMIIIQVGAFIGGSYFPVELIPDNLKWIADLSPLAWTNGALLGIIYADDGSAAAKAVLLNVGFSAALLGTALLLMRRREGL